MSRTADWFSKLSKKAQSEYIKAHPNSKYAKAGKAKSAEATAKPLAWKKLYAAVAVGAPKQTKDQWKTNLKKLETLLGKATLASDKKAIKSAIVRVTAMVSAKKAKAAPASSAAKVKAHDVKRATDKNKVIAKTPSAKSNKAGDIAHWKEELKRVQTKLKAGGLNATTKARYERIVKTAKYQIKDLLKAPVKAAAKPRTVAKPTKASGLAVVKKDRARRIAVLTSQLAEAKAAKAKARTPASIAKHHQNVLKFQRHLAAAKRMAAKVK